MLVYHFDMETSLVLASIIDENKLKSTLQEGISSSTKIHLCSFSIFVYFLLSRNETSPSNSQLTEFHPLPPGNKSFENKSRELQKNFH